MVYCHLLTKMKHFHTGFIKMLNILQICYFVFIYYHAIYPMFSRKIATIVISGHFRVVCFSKIVAATGYKSLNTCIILFILI